MKVLYKDSKVKKICTDEKLAIKKLGKDVATRLFAAINLLLNAKNLKDILVFPQYKLHLLKGNYKGVYSMYLGKTTGFRLLLIPLDKDEKVVETEDMSVYTITVCVEIMEVSKHYEK